MAAVQSPDREFWTSRLTFLLASIGFAAGLGNIWRFPYLVGENGGSAFIVVYLLFAFGIGVPMVMSEWAIGRGSRDSSSASGSLRSVARLNGRSQAWGYVGGTGVLAVFMLMLFYTVIAGWTLHYLISGLSGGFNGIDAAGSTQLFDDLLGDPVRMAFWHTVVVLFTVYVNSLGLHAGIENATRILMPALFVSLAVMVVYAAVAGDFGSAAGFMLKADFSRITPEVMLIALGQAFFSIGIAMAVMITYGSHLGPGTSIPRNAFIVVGADILVALLAGFAIFPLVFAYGLSPDAGTGLVFQTLPIAFGELPAGRWISSIFFLLLFAAAATSCIGNFAPVVAWTKEKLSLSQAKSAALAGAVMWLLGLLSVLSFNLLSDFHPLAFIDRFGDKTIFDSLEYVMSNILLPAGAFMTAVFMGWAVSADFARDSMGLESALGFRIWRFLMRYVVPVAIGLLFVFSVGG